MTSRAIAPLAYQAEFEKSLPGGMYDLHTSVTEDGIEYYVDKNLGFRHRGYLQARKELADLDKKENPNRTEVPVLKHKAVFEIVLGRGFDYTLKLDGWGREIYLHDRIQALYSGFERGYETQEGKLHPKLTVIVKKEEIATAMKNAQTALAAVSHNHAHDLLCELIGAYNKDRTHNVFTITYHCNPGEWNNVPPHPPAS